MKRILLYILLGMLGGLVVLSLAWGFITFLQFLEAFASKNIIGITLVVIIGGLYGGLVGWVRLKEK